DVTIVPAALGRVAGETTLNVAEDPGSSSLYEPDQEVIATRPELTRIRVVDRVPVTLTTLDEWAADAGVERVDALKLDVQGAALDVLAGAEERLSDVRVVETEVEFNPMYREQPLFADVDRFLRERDFVL